MATKSNRYVDHQGRIILPAHIRQALNLGKGHAVEISLDDEGCIRIKPVLERCCVCGDAVSDKHHTEVKTENGDKFVCYECAQNIARAMMK